MDESTNQKIHCNYIKYLRAPLPLQTPTQPPCRVPEVFTLTCDLWCWSFGLRTASAETIGVPACEVRGVDKASCSKSRWCTEGLFPSGVSRVPRGPTGMGIGNIAMTGVVQSCCTDGWPIVTDASTEDWTLVLASRGLVALDALHRLAWLAIFMCTLLVPTLMSANSRNMTSITEACGRSLCASCLVHMGSIPATGVSSAMAYVRPLLHTSWLMRSELKTVLVVCWYPGCEPRLGVALCNASDTYQRSVGGWSW
jgi:hypothetical protein